MAQRLRIEDITKPEIIAKIEEWAVNGLTNVQIAKNLKIGVSTFYAWKNQSKEIADALKKGKEVSDDQVENALFKRAIGFQTVEQKYEVVDMGDEEFDTYSQVLLDAWKEENPKWTVAQRDKFIQELPREKKILVEEKVKEVAPETLAAIFWLKNRRPEGWRDRKNIEMSGGVSTNNNIDLSGISTEDLKKYTETLEKAIKEGEGHDGN